MHMSDDRVGSVAKPRICGNRVKHRMPQFPRWDEKPSALGAVSVDRLDFLDCSGPSYTAMAKLATVVRSGSSRAVEEAERIEMGRRGHCHHVREPVERRRKRAF